MVFGTGHFRIAHSFEDDQKRRRANVEKLPIGSLPAQLTSSFGAVSLASGTYWLNLDNAVVNDGDPIYWDENSGRSLASENSVGTIPSEAFTVLGTSTTTYTDSVPECNTFLLFGPGLLGLAGLLRRKLP